MGGARSLRVLSRAKGASLCILVQQIHTPRQSHINACRPCRRAGKRRRPREAHRPATWRPGPARRVRAENARDRLAGPVATTWIEAPLVGRRLGSDGWSVTVRAPVRPRRVLTARRYGIPRVGIHWISHTVFGTSHHCMDSVRGQTRSASMCGRYVTLDEAAMERAYTLICRPGATRRWWSRARSPCRPASSPRDLGSGEPVNLFRRHPRRTSQPVPSLRGPVRGRPGASGAINQKRKGRHPAECRPFIRRPANHGR
jgi:hypothetical protein